MLIMSTKCVNQRKDLVGCFLFMKGKMIMEQIIYNIEKGYAPKTLPSVVPAAYQALFMLNLKMEEIKKYTSVSTEGYVNENGPEKAKPEEVPIKDKVTLTIKEAAEYSNIGINKLESILRSTRCPFVLYVGNKKLVKRKEFEKYIAENIEI